MLGLLVAIVGGVMIEMIIQIIEGAIAIIEGTLRLLLEFALIAWELLRLGISLLRWRVWKWNMAGRIARI